MDILLSRTDNLGDVALTLPMAGIIKKHYPEARVHFLGRRYSLPVAQKSDHIDHFYDWDRLKKGSIGLPEIDSFIHVFPDKAISRFARDRAFKNRIGTSHRLHHWYTCTHLVHFTRRKSYLHESQLNFKLLKPLGITEIPAISEIHSLAGWQQSGTSVLDPLLSRNKFNLIFHMLSGGSGKEWPLTKYLGLAHKLPQDEFQIFLTGTEEEGERIRQKIPALLECPNVTDVTGRFQLETFIPFLEACDGLVACGTGPLHIASLAGIKTLGLFPSQRPIDPGRWGPIGPQASWLTEVNPGDGGLLNIPIDNVQSIISTWMK